MFNPSSFAEDTIGSDESNTQLNTSSKLLL